MDQVEVTCFSIGDSNEDLQESVEVLSAAEEGRAARFHFAHDRVRYIRAHALLRSRLAEVLSCKPEEIEYETSPTGKPLLAGRWAAAPWRFNLSHSGDLMAVATTRAREVGVDIERVRSIAELPDLAQRCLSPSEHRHFSALTGEAALSSFIRLWTRKEAVLKAMGTGLRTEPREIETGLDETDEGIVVECPAGRGWRVLSFQPAEAYWGAVAVEAS